MKQSWRTSLSLLGVHHPRKVLMLGLLLMVVLASGLKQLYKDTRADAFLAADNPALVYKNKVREIFGLSDPLVIAIQDASFQGVYRPETLQLVEEITTQIDTLDNINADRTISLATENNIVGTEGGMDVSPFYERVQTPDAIRTAIKDFPLYDGMLVSDDQAMTVIVAVLISSKVVPLTYFGTIVVLSVTMSFLAAMTLLPALVMVIQPRFIYGQKRQNTPGHKPVNALFSVIVLTGSVIVASLLFAPQSAEAVERIEAEEIVASVNAVDDGQQVTSDLTMILTDRRGKQRIRKTKSYRKYFPTAEAAKQEKKTVFFYQSPKNVKGTGFLTYDYPQADRDDDQWLYLPALRKVRRISASDRGDYFMGTDFSYEDIKLAAVDGGRSVLRR